MKSQVAVATLFAIIALLITPVEAKNTRHSADGSSAHSIKPAKATAEKKTGSKRKTVGDAIVDYLQKSTSINPQLK